MARVLAIGMLFFARQQESPTNDNKFQEEPEPSCKMSSFFKAHHDGLACFQETRDLTHSDRHECLAAIRDISRSLHHWEWLLLGGASSTSYFGLLAVVFFVQPQVTQVTGPHFFSVAHPVRTPMASDGTLYRLRLSYSRGRHNALTAARARSSCFLGWVKKCFVQFGANLLHVDCTFSARHCDCL
jgi:hypothetical protein